ncbi:hypothetical protein CFE70_008760 [Pyrenophora teres f. teres 0-1]|uniref:AA1-like domain-containing protein n=2 Tax=Pyrenophora teres f. teres TaxID=97479 RepID=E3RF41_PYRTT|nr:hypothetical protein PTT_05597 [Pyrenophora teres f. teres 0-1]KAE8824860.1 hypothetical protein PTNB85_09624 [Pyrenophora teres f. teres]CAA9965523.1 major allergen alt [Pyrenophora teres f. maculata]KAE8831700.1 hypothetical protein HRS9139_05942 [Pyrenophora teres f. teres]KAE8835562.1 hypothetical protein HRS9122_07832 [Pyrenophora teres f. teres]
MQFLALAALFSAAIAAPAPEPLSLDPTYNEVIAISNYTLTTQLGDITNVRFNLTGKDATNLNCASGAIKDLSKRFPCDPINGVPSVYSFSIYATDGDESRYGQRIYREVKIQTNTGYWGDAIVPTNCFKFEPNAISPTTCYPVRSDPITYVNIDQRGVFDH